MAKQNKKFVATTLTASMVALAVAPAAGAAFTDSIPNYAKDAVGYVTEKGIMKGLGGTTEFGAAKNITRAEVAVVLASALGLETEGKTASFADVPATHWASGAIAAVVEAGYAQGTDKGFEPSKNISRQEVAVMFAKAYELELNELAEVSFKDQAKIASWSKDQVAILASLGIMGGKEGGAFAPTDLITRGEVATLVHRTEVADVRLEVTEKESAVVDSIKAINATTVEVTYKEAKTDVNATKYTIEGLTVSNAAVKQTDAKTVVLTTSVQEGDKEYTVVAGEETLGKFKGVSAVVPTKVELVSSSVQGKLGQEITVKAQVTVKEGDSKSGIPVTFSVPTQNSLTPAITVEALTNEAGVATYSYTRYAAVTDTVTAYATGDRSKFSTGYVFWGVDTILSVEEVTKGETINNGANKTYKVTFKNAETGKPVANKTLNVSVLENINVTANKLQNVTVNGIEVAQLSNSTVTRAAQVTTNSNGEATFTVSGTNAEATPVVYEAFNTVTNGVDYKYDASDLQVSTTKVKFAAIQAEYTIELTRDGGEVAATGQANGREYKVVVKDKDGKVAKNETVNVAFSENLDRVIATNTKAGFVNTDTDTYYPTTGNGNTKTQISIKTNDKGEATFVIASDEINDYATPQAWIDVNSANAKQGSLDEGEPTTIGEISHFQAAYLDGAEVKAYKAGKPSKNFDGTETAEFKAELVNQSGKVFTGGYTVGKVTYTVFNTGADDIEVGNTIISSNRSETFTTDSGASLYVRSAEGKSTSVRVVASGSARKDGKDFAFTAKEATATFTNSAVVGTEYTGYLRGFNNDAKTVTFDGKNAVKYAGESGKTYEYYGTNGAPIIGDANFINALIAAADFDSNGTADRAVRATYRVVDNVVKFYLLDVTTQTVAGFVTTKQNVPEIPGVTGTIAFANSSFNASSTQTITVTDNDLNISTTVADTTIVNISGNGASFNLTLTETGVNTGVFTGTITTAQLGLFVDGTITATYNDAKTAAGVAGVATATATLNTVVGGVSYNAAATTPYAEAQPVLTAAKVTGSDVSQVIGTGGLVLNIDGTQFTTTVTGISPGTSKADSAAAVAAEINAAAKAVSIISGSETVATVVGDALVITSPTNGTGSSVAVVNLGGTTGLGLTVAPAVTGTSTPGTATKAQWKFTLTTLPAVGETIKVKVGSVEKSHTVVLSDDLAAIATALNTAFGADFAVDLVAGTNILSVTQGTAAPTDAELTVTITK